MASFIKNIAYYNELMYRCDTSKKGFIFLLLDEDFILEEYNNNSKIKSSSINELKNKFGCKFIDKKQSEYFFKHLHLYFDYNENETNNTFSINDKYACIISSIVAYVDNPLNYIVSILNKNYNDSNIINTLKTKTFKSLLNNQLEYLGKDKKEISEEINKESFSENQRKLYIDIVILVDEFKKYSLFDVINLIVDTYKKENESDSKNPSSPSNYSENIIEDSSMQELKNEIKSKITKKNKSNKNKNFFSEGILNNFFNPMESYVEDVHDKYKFLKEQMSYDSYSCRSIKTILYLATYLLKDKSNKDFKAAHYMKKLLNADIGWAVGNENNKEPSFYGKSDFSKFIYGYYSYMNAKENPYTDLINNKIVKEMDDSAILIHKYFRENGLNNIAFDNGKINDLYNLLVNFREIVRIIDAPISLSGTFDNFIAGIVSSILNSAATVLDFAISEVVKSLFYSNVVKINDKMYSISQIYNYLNFIKLILENAGEYDDIDYIDREEFVNQAYSILGVEQSTFKKNGYLAFDQELNHIASLNVYDGRLYQNQFDMLFTVKKDLKLFYSLVQFGIQKKAVLTGDNNYESKFSYGDKYAINDVLNYLTETEIFYIFKLYNINIFRLDDNLGYLTEEEILEFNKNLLYIDSVYNHNSINFYNLYLSSDINEIYKETIEYSFETTKYKELIQSMKKFYFKVIDHNMKEIDNIVFEGNNIGDIDDFFLRFIPSITEILKLLGQNANSIQAIAGFIDKILLFISNVLFRNLFVTIKKDINKLVKKFTSKAFEKINEYIKKKHPKDENESPIEIVLDPNFGDTKFMQAVDLIINAIENNRFELLNVETCFKNVSKVENIYDPMEYDDLIYNYGHNTIQKNEFAGNVEESLDKSYIGAIEKEDKEENDDKTFIDNIVDGSKDFFESIKQDIDKVKDKFNKRVFYENGEIKLEKKDGSISVVVSKEDLVNDDYVYISNSDVVSKNLSEDEFKQLVEIRDYIDNIKNQLVSSLNKKLSIERSKLAVEMNKPFPNYSFIETIKKKIADLTSKINDVKTENRIISTFEDTNDITIKDFQKDNSDSDQNIYSTLNDYFKNKKEILKEVNNIVINNDVVLTNYQITELLK